MLPEPLGDALEEAAVQLFRIGYDRVAGALAGGLAAWAGSGAQVAAYPTTTIEALHGDAVEGRNAYALDVRDPLEWREDGVVPGAIQIPLSDLPDRLASIPVTRLSTSSAAPDGVPASPRASSTRPGLEVRSVAQGGAADWPAAAPAIPADPPR